MKNYIFSGFGHSSGKYRISNNDIIEAIRKDFLHGFREDKILGSENFRNFKRKQPDVSAFDYFAGYKMGFFTRHHVTPFPPTKKKLFYAETSLELGVKAIQNAISDAGIQVNDISAWFVSTVSPHEQAPGIAASIKAHFTDFDNNTSTLSIASGCSGFNLNLERAIEYLKVHQEAKHVVVAHTETMSSFLTQRMKFIPFVTFGDAAAAVILTRFEDDTKYGIIDISNNHDMQMVDFVGVDKSANLYMEDSVIKDRAIVNMSSSGKEILAKSDWTSKEIDLFIPHQTGNAIILPASKNMGLNEKQIYLEAQKEYGNVSGATVAISLSMLHDENRLKPGQKILSSVAGVGGQYGAFTYLVPPEKTHKPSILHQHDLIGKTCLVTGSTGALGSEIAIELGKRGAHIILHHNQNYDKAKNLASRIEKLGGKTEIIEADFRDNESIENFLITITTNFSELHYIIHAAGITETPTSTDNPTPDEIMQVNCFSALTITKRLFPILKETVIYLGTAAEDITIEGFPDFVASKSCLHGAAGSAAGELISKGIRSIYYMSAILDSGLSQKIPQKTAFNFMMQNGQEKPISTEETAQRIVSSLYIPKVLGVRNQYEGPMVLRRDGYVLETDV